MDKVLKKKIKNYQKTYKRHGLNPKSLQWVTKESADIRYEQIVADLDFEKKSVLDVGCGFGDLISILSENTMNLQYVGVDVVPEFIEAAKHKFPGYKFLLNDYFAEPMSEFFDIIVSSGTLNSKREDVVSFRKEAIKAMFEHCKEAVIFNMAGGYPQPKNRKRSKIYYADALDILRYCLKLTSKTIFRYHYRRRDFTVVMFK